MKWALVCFSLTLSTCPHLCLRNVLASSQVTRLTSLCPNHESPYVIMMKKNRDGPFYMWPIVSVWIKYNFILVSDCKCHTKLQTRNTNITVCLCRYVPMYLHVLIYYICKLLKIAFLMLPWSPLCTVHNSIIVHVIISLCTIYWHTVLYVQVCCGSAWVRTSDRSQRTAFLSWLKGLISIIMCAPWCYPMRSTQKIKGSLSTTVI